MVVTEMPCQKVPLFEWNLANHAPGGQMLQDLRIGKQGLDGVILNRLTKGVEQQIQGRVMWIRCLGGSMISLQMSSESM